MSAQPLIRSARTTGPSSEKTAARSGRGFLILAVTSVLGRSFEARPHANASLKNRTHRRRLCNSIRTDASANPASQINTSRRKPYCHSSAARKRRCTGRRSAQPLCRKPARHSRNTGFGNNWSIRCNILLDNSRCHTPSHTVPLHILPGKLLRDLRKGSTAMLWCDAWL